MATRNKPNNSHETVLKGIFEGSSKTLAVTLDDLKAFTQLSTMDALSLMVDMEEAKLIETAGRGENMVGWIFTEDSQTGLTRSQVASELPTLAVEKPKRTRRTKAEMKAARIEAAEKNAYNTRLAEGQDGVLSQAPVTTTKDEAMETETNETPNESESAPVEAPKPFVMEEHKSSLEERGLILDEPETIPAKPEGVSDNAWYMAHAAITQTARDWWLNYCHTQAMSEALDAS